MIDKELIHRIRRIMMENNLSQTLFAEKAGLHQPTVSAKKNGRSGIGNKTISKICDTYNINERWLITGEGEMYCVNGGRGVNIGKMGDGNRIENNVTHNNGRSEKDRMEEGCMRQGGEKRSDATLNRVLAMLQESFSKIGELQRTSDLRMEKLEQVSAERNRISERLLDMLQEKDAQVSRLVEQIDKLAKCVAGWGAAEGR